MKSCSNSQYIRQNMYYSIKKKHNLSYEPGHICIQVSWQDYIFYGTERVSIMNLGKAFLNMYRDKSLSFIQIHILKCLFFVQIHCNVHIHSKKNIFFNLIHCIFAFYINTHLPTSNMFRQTVCFLSFLRGSCFLLFQKHCLLQLLLLKQLISQIK